MKTPQKTKKTIRKKANSASKTAVKLVHGKRSVLRHFRLVDHKHTGSLIHVRHSSHVALVGILVIVGFFLVISQNLVSASHLSSSGSVTVGLVVSGPPPTDGATITSPISGTTIANLNPTDVSGTCFPNSFVVIQNNASLAGSTICTAGGAFLVSVQLSLGQNILTAKNYDNLNQAGPDTSAVTVTFEIVNEDPVVQPEQPILPENPLIIPGVTTGPSECDSYQPSSTLLTGGDPHVAVVCVPRSIDANQDHKIGVLVWGGKPPYAINFKWGSGDTTLISMNAPGYKSVKVRYASSGVYNINIQLTDQSNKAATGESAVEVTNAATPQTFTQVVDNILSTSWFETPVPLYVTALALTLGFWGGDIFHRKFGSTKHQRRSHKAT